MSKYDPLRDYLTSATKAEITLDFAEIETILGTNLPPSARQYQAWWSEGEAGQHVQKWAWFNAGYKVENLDLGRQHVTFRRTPK